MSEQTSTAHQELVLMDFTADWCGPCQTMLPIVERLEEEMRDKLSVFRIDVDAHPELTSNFRIRSVPTFILFKDGKECWRKAGMISARKLREEINKFDYLHTI